MFALLLASAVAAGPDAARGLTLTGVVLDDGGRPAPKATVFVRTARPRVGVGVL